MIKMLAKWIFLSLIILFSLILLICFTILFLYFKDDLGMLIGFIFGVFLIYDMIVINDYIEIKKKEGAKIEI